jgi:hypothetical protein
MNRNYRVRAYDRDVIFEAGFFRVRVSQRERTGTLFDRRVVCGEFVARLRNRDAEKRS